MQKVPQPNDKAMSPPPATQRVPPGISVGPQRFLSPQKIQIIKNPGNDLIHLQTTLRKRSNMNIQEPEVNINLGQNHSKLPEITVTND